MSKHKKKKAQLEKLELEILKWTAIGSGLQLTDDLIKMINKLGLTNDRAKVLPICATQI